MIHAGQRPDPYTGARAVPIFQTTSYVFEDADSAAAYFNLQEYGNTYSRIMNPTTAVLEERSRASRAGAARSRFASGLAAQSAALFTLLEPGDHVVASQALYGGTITQLKHLLRKLVGRARLRRPGRPDAWRAALRPETKALFAETIGNPGGNVLDIEAVAAIAHEAGAPLIVDNTFATPYLCRPFEWGADIVIHSATKYLGGHGTSIGGLVVDSGGFDWANGRFPIVTDPSPAYHGLAFYETFGRVRLPDEAARGVAARPRRVHEPVQRVPLPAGPRDAVAADGAARRERGRRRAVPRGRTRASSRCATRAWSRARTGRSSSGTCRAARPGSSRSTSPAAARRGARSSRRSTCGATSPTSATRRASSSTPRRTTHRQLSDEELAAAGHRARHDPALGRPRDARRPARRPRAGLAARPMRRPERPHEDESAHIRHSSDDRRCAPRGIRSIRGRRSGRPPDRGVPDRPASHVRRGHVRMSERAGPARYQDPDTIRSILHSARTIAIVGLSGNVLRPSHFVGFYLQRHGYRVLPVNPREERDPRRAELPVARRPARGARRRRRLPRARTPCPAIAREAVDVGAGTLWLQFGVISPEGAEIAEQGGLKVVDRPLHEGRARAPPRAHALARLQHRPDHGPARRGVIEAVVMGRVGVDLYPNQIETPLSEVRTFTRFVGGFAGNVATGLARLGVRTAIVSRVGDDGHGEFVRDFLDAEGIDTRFLARRPGLAHAADLLRGLAARPLPAPLLPPAHRARLADLARTTSTPRRSPPRRCSTRPAPGSRSRRAARRRSPRCARTAARRSSTSTGGPRSGPTPAEYPALAAEAIAAADIVVGNEEEVEAARAARRPAARAEARRRGHDRARGRRRHRRARSRPVEVVNGLGAGDAFARGARPRAARRREPRRRGAPRLGRGRDRRRAGSRARRRCRRWPSSAERWTRRRSVRRGAASAGRRLWLRARDEDACGARSPTVATRRGRVPATSCGRSTRTELGAPATYLDEIVEALHLAWAGASPRRSAPRDERFRAATRTTDARARALRGEPAGRLLAQPRAGRRRRPTSIGVRRL